jgi:hypothetical protein
VKWGAKNILTDIDLMHDAFRVGRSMLGNVKQLDPLSFAKQKRPRYFEWVDMEICLLIAMAIGCDRNQML